jgi:hypothetical protein
MKPLICLLSGVAIVFSVACSPSFVAPQSMDAPADSAGIERHYGNCTIRATLQDVCTDSAITKLPVQPIP